MTKLFIFQILPLIDNAILKIVQTMKTIICIIKFNSGRTIASFEITGKDSEDAIRIAETYGTIIDYTEKTKVNTVISHCYKNFKPMQF